MGTFLEKIAWMHWTVPGALFFGGIFLSIAIIGICENYKPAVERKGFLPIPTTPGDRLFISILYIIAVFLIWLAIFSKQYLWIPCLISIISVSLIGLYG